MNARTYAQFLKALRRPIGEITQLPIRELPVHEIERGIGRPFGRRTLEDLRQRHRFQFCIPANAFRIRLDPGCRHGRIFPLGGYELRSIDDRRDKARWQGGSVLKTILHCEGLAQWCYAYHSSNEWS